MSDTATAERTIQQTRPKGVLPYIHVEGAAEAVKFYEKALGAKELSRTATDDGRRIMNCQLEINGGPMMLMDAMPDAGYPFQPTHSFTLQLIVDDGQAWFDRAVAAGCTVPMPFQKMFWGDKWGAVIDPYQIRWAFDEPTAGRRRVCSSLAPCLPQPGPEIRSCVRVEQ